MRLKRILSKKSGRDSSGKVTVRHQGGRMKRFMREVDFKRSKKEVWARVGGFEYDPNRNVDLALIYYEDGEKSYIIAPAGLKEGSRVISSESAPIEVGNALPLAKIPIGTPIHNIEIRKGKGGQLVRSAGSQATVQGREEKYVLIRMPSAEIRRIDPFCIATVGQVGNIEARTERLGKAGRKRKMGIRPSVRGTAQNPRSHPHGGGEGRSGVGMKYKKTFYGRKAVGKTRRRRKYSDKFIVTRRKSGKFSN